MPAATRSKSRPAASSGKARGLKISHDQQHSLWPMLDAAWKRFCKENEDDPTNSKAKDDWRRGQLFECLGLTSLTQLRRSGPQFALWMAHLEVIAKNGVRWQMQVHGSDRRHLIHKIREVCGEYDLDEAYARGVARQALGVDTLPHLDEIEPEQLVTVLQILKTNVRKMQAEKGEAAGGEEGRPF